MYKFYYKIFYNELVNGMIKHYERVLIKSTNALSADNVQKLITEKIGHKEIEISLSSFQQIDIDTFIMLGGHKNSIFVTVDDPEAIQQN